MELLAALKVFATEVLQYWKQLLILALMIALVYGAYSLGVNQTSNKYEKQLKENAEQVSASEEQFTREKQEIAAAYEKYRLTHPLVKEVYVYVDPKNDSLYPLSNGFVRVHNAAAEGIEIGSPNELDGQASTFTASSAAKVISSNYEICNDSIKRLELLQDVVVAFQEKQNQYK